MARYIEEEIKTEILASKDSVFISEIRGDCWKVKKYKGEFYFQYLSGELSGKTKIIKITEADYKMCTSGQHNQNQLCIKFGVS